jgi:hypothetical protein
MPIASKGRPSGSTREPPRVFTGATGRPNRDSEQRAETPKLLTEEGGIPRLMGVNSDEGVLAARQASNPQQGGIMDFSAQLDDLQQRAAQTKQAAQAAVTETREQLRQRIDQAKVDVDLAAKDARQDASAAAASAKSKWAQLKADAAAKMDDLQARIDKRADQIDANVAADDAAWAEDDAAAAIDYASWTVDNARLAVLDAIDARAYADELATKAGT